MKTWTETAELPLDELKPAPWNPNVQDGPTFRQQVESIRRFGFVGPVVVRAEDRLIIAGHHRVRALAEIGGVDHVQCVLVRDLSDAEAKALSLALNQIHGEFEPEALEAALRELTEADISLDGLGFDDSDLGDLSALAVGDSFPDEGSVEDSVEMTFEIPAPLAHFVTDAVKRERKRGAESDGIALARVCQRVARRTT